MYTIIVVHHETLSDNDHALTMHATSLHTFVHQLCKYHCLLHETEGKAQCRVMISTSACDIITCLISHPFDHKEIIRFSLMLLPSITINTLKLFILLNGF